VRCCPLVGNIHAYTPVSVYLSNIYLNGVTCVRPTNIYYFYHLKFQVSPSQTAVTSSPRLSGPNLSDLSLPNYHIWGNAGVLSQAATKVKYNYRV